MNNKATRFKQRYSNFKKAYLQLDSAMSRFDELSNLEKEGLIQRFEYTFELAWKTTKDYLVSKEVDAKFPREVIKYAFEYDIISDGDVWLDMLEKRNLLAHTYDEERFDMAITNIKDEYFGAITQVYNYLGDALCNME